MTTGYLNKPKTVVAGALLSLALISAPVNAHNNHGGNNDYIAPLAAFVAFSWLTHRSYHGHHKHRRHNHYHGHKRRHSHSHGGYNTRKHRNYNH